MNMNEFGLFLRDIFPELKQVPLNNAALGQRMLNRYPKFYDAVSATAARVKDISEERFESQRFTEHGRLESKGIHIGNQTAEIEMLHKADLVIKASALGLSVPAMIEMEVETHKTNEHIRKETAMMMAGLRGTQEASLKPHQLIARRRAELNALIDERDKETHPDKREILEILINSAKEELRGRTNQEVVQNGGRSGLRLVNQDPDSAGSGEPSSETDSDAVPTADSRPGKRRAGFSS